MCPDEKDPDCKEKVASFKVGATVGLKYEAKLGVVKVGAKAAELGAVDAYATASWAAIEG